MDMASAASKMWQAQKFVAASKQTNYEPWDEPVTAEERKQIEDLLQEVDRKEEQQPFIPALKRSSESETPPPVWSWAVAGSVLVAGVLSADWLHTVVGL
jgi:hypothetical protein